MQKKGSAGVIFTLVFMLVIFIAVYVFLMQFFEATPELTALTDFKVAIENVCIDGGPDATVVPIVLPEKNKLLLKSEGFVILERPSGSTVKKPLNCVHGTTFSSCTIGPTSLGSESLQLEVMKTNGKISLNETDLVKCEV